MNNILSKYMQGFLHLIRVLYIRIVIICFPYHFTAKTAAYKITYNEGRNSHMKIFKNCRKTAIVIAAGLILANGCTVPAMAHGHHGGGHCGSSYNTGTYCAYHNKVHKKASNCKYYCEKHCVTHKNGKCH